MKIILVDGYNVIYASPSLKILLSRSLYKAQDKLIEMVCRHCSLQNIRGYVVFDAYRRDGEERVQEVSPLVKVVYTAGGKTADSFIERFIAKNKSRYTYIYVITSDLAQGMTVLDDKIIPVSPKSFLSEVKISLDFINKRYSPQANPFVSHLISGDTLREILKKKIVKNRKRKPG